MFKPGDRVLYRGPTYQDRYFPALEQGIIVSIGHTRATVRFPWGLQYLRLDSLKSAMETVPSTCADASPECVAHLL
jgi:hypothetical protein